MQANRAFYRTFQVKPAETEQRLIYQLGNHQWDIPELRALLNRIICDNTAFEDYEIAHDFPDIGYRKMRLNARRIRRRMDQLALILLAIETGNE